MAIRYQDSDDFASYLEYFSKKRLLALLDLTSTIAFFAAKETWKGSDPPFSFLLTKLRFSNLEAYAKSIRLSMSWMAQGVEWASKQLFTTLRSELEKLELLTIEKQPPRQGKHQPITAISGINFEGLLLLSRAIIVRLYEMAALEQEDDDAEPDWDSWLPRHGFEYFAQLFRKLMGYGLFEREELARATREERREELRKQEIAEYEEPDRRSVEIWGELEQFNKEYEAQFGRPIEDKTFCKPSEKQIGWLRYWDNRFRVRRDLQRRDGFLSDLRSGKCTSWDDFRLRDFDRLEIDEYNKIWRKHVR